MMVANQQFNLDSTPRPSCSRLLLIRQMHHLFVLCIANQGLQAQQRLHHAHSRSLPHSPLHQPAPLPALSEQHQQQPTLLPQLPAAPPSPFHFPSNELPSTALGLGFGDSNNQQQQDHLQQLRQSSISPGIGVNQQGRYLGPQPQRLRSKSDTSLRPPVWQVVPQGQQIQMEVVDVSDDVLQGQQQQQQQIPRVEVYHAQQQNQQAQQQASQGHAPLTHGYTYSPPVNPSAGPSDLNGTNANQNGSNTYLSPSLGLGIGGADLRRNRSDSGTIYGHRRGVRSEDIRFSNSGGLSVSSMLVPPTSQHDFLSAQQHHSLGGSGGSSTPAYMHSPAGSSVRSLSPGPPSSLSSVRSHSPLLNGGSPGSGVGVGGVGLHRRTSSASGVLTSPRSISRERSSPYPSPHASPRNVQSDLPGGVSVSISDGRGGVSTSVVPGPPGALGGMGGGTGASSGIGLLGMGGMGGAVGPGGYGGLGMQGGAGGMHMRISGMDRTGPGGMGVGLGPGVGVGVGAGGLGASGPGGQPGAGGNDSLGLGLTNVTRPTVTSPATEEASRRRRRTDANFVCPVPGCGSTFTRHFNLKGTF